MPCLPGLAARLGLPPDLLAALAGCHCLWSSLARGSGMSTAVTVIRVCRMKLHSGANCLPPVLELWEAKLYRIDMEIMFVPTSSSGFRSPLHTGNSPPSQTGSPCLHPAMDLVMQVRDLWDGQGERSPVPFAKTGREGQPHRKFSVSISAHAADVFSVCRHQERLPVFFCLCPSLPVGVRLTAGLPSWARFLVKYQELVRPSRQDVRAAWAYASSGGETLLDFALFKFALESAGAATGTREILQPVERVNMC